VEAQRTFQRNYGAQAILALRDPQENTKALMAVGKALFGAVKTVAQGSLDKNFLSDLATVGRWGETRT